MRAIVYEELGGPGVLRVAEIEEPHAGPGEVRIAVRATAVNPADVWARLGFLEEYSKTSFPAVPGFEVAGVVDELGDGVAEFAVGDEVVGLSKSGANKVPIAGGYAQYVLAGADTVALKPANVSWEQAAAIPVGAETAQRALNLLHLKQGETLLVHGAAGGVGNMAVQLAVAMGVTVIGTASAQNHDYVRSLGAIPVTYGDGLVGRVREAAPQGIDAVYEAAGRGALPDSIELRGDTERIVTTTDPVGSQQLRVQMSFGGHRPAEEVRADLVKQLQMVIDGKLKVAVETLALADAAKAHEISEAGHVRGKLVLIP
jgi:NADPH:quinone reductase-like Zn-dependent oxidoreductase